MDAKIIKVTDKGQISIPIEIRESLKINQGDKLLVLNNSDSIILKKVNQEDFSDLLSTSNSIFRRIWDNKEDEVWENV